MAQKKLLRFSIFSSLNNTFEHYDEIKKGTWRNFFKNDNPIVLELACGRGEYTVALAEMHKDKNFIGVDIKGNRMYLGAKALLTKNLNNGAFLRIEIESIASYFEKGEVDEIWITFPDPQLRTSRAKKRLTHPRFLREYAKILKPEGVIRLKTDSPALYKFSQQVTEMYGIKIQDKSADLYAGAHTPEQAIRTHYEALDIASSQKIFYLAFALPPILPEYDDKLQRLIKETEKSEDHELD